jgi:hypothetical protein
LEFHSFTVYSSLLEIIFNGKLLCVICSETLAVVKVYSFWCHFIQNVGTLLTTKWRWPKKLRYRKLTSKLQVNRIFSKTKYSTQNTATKATYFVS